MPKGFMGFKYLAERYLPNMSSLRDSFILLEFLLQICRSFGAYSL